MQRMKSKSGIRKQGNTSGKVHKFKRAPKSKISCHEEVLDLIAIDENGKFKKEWHPRVRKSEKKSIDDGLNEDNCFFCNQPLCREKFRDAVRDHCHITGEFRGVAHNACNISYFRISPKKTIIHVVFHNLRGYDAHHLMQEIAAVDANLTCIPNNMEKYISFSLGNLRFIDSFQFLCSSLNSLVSSNKLEDFEIMKHFEPDGERRALVLSKGVYPYEYMDSFERFNETSLPSKEGFHSTHTDSDISDEDYEHAKKVWEAYGCKNLGHYHDLYLRNGCSSPCRRLENFRKTCLKLQLGPGSLLHKPRVELGRASWQYLHDYDPDKETSYILYLDANNLYGWAMSQPLPVGNFRWTQKIPTKRETMSWRVNRRTGYILEVDLEYIPKISMTSTTLIPWPQRQGKCLKNGTCPTKKNSQENSVYPKTKPKSFSSPSGIKVTMYSTAAISSSISVWA